MPATASGSPIRDPRASRPPCQAPGTGLMAAVHHPGLSERHSPASSMPSQARLRKSTSFASGSERPPSSLPQVSPRLPSRWVTADHRHPPSATYRTTRQVAPGYRAACPGRDARQARRSLLHDAAHSQVPASGFLTQDTRSRHFRISGIPAWRVLHRRCTDLHWSCMAAASRYRRFAL